MTFEFAPGPTIGDDIDVVVTYVSETYVIRVGTLTLSSHEWNQLNSIIEKSEDMEVKPR